LPINSLLFSFENKNIMAVIICKSCGEENEPGRIYCNECNQKLDAGNLSGLVGNKGDALTKTTIQKKIKASQKKDRPRAAAQTVSNLFSAFVKLVILVILIGIIGTIGYGGYLMYDAPEDIPKWKAYSNYGKWEIEEQVAFEESFDRANITKLDLEDALLNRMAMTAKWNEKDVNAWLSRNLPEKPVKFGPIDGRFIGAYIQFEADGIMNLIMRYKIFDQPVYFQYKINTSMEQGNLYSQYISGAINSLPIHQMIIERLAKPLDPIQAVFIKNKARLNECDSLEIRDQEIIITCVQKNIPDIDPFAAPPVPAEASPTPEDKPAAPQP